MRVSDSPKLDRFRLRITSQAIVAAIGTALIVIAAAARQDWLDRHFLPSFLLPRQVFVRLETVVRVGLAASGMLLVVAVRPRVGRFVDRAGARAGYMAIAALLAVVATEPVLRHMQLRPVEWLSPDEEPRRRADTQLGWTLVPSRTGRATVAGRVVEYALDAAGYRVRRVDQPVDPEQPAMLFTGESVMFGEGLTWDESVPAQTGALLGVQTANLAVHGFASDQAYLRLRAEWPRFRRPLAIVSLFMPSLFGRNLDSERPHLGPGLVWQPPVQRWRLESLARRFVFYHSERVIDRGVGVTREVLRATAALGRSRGVPTLVVVPQFGPEDSAEQHLRRRVLDGLGVPYVLVEIDPGWRLRWNRHPDARAAHVIAVAVADRLRRSGVNVTSHVP